MDDVQKRDAIEAAVDVDPGRPGVQYFEDDQEYNRGFRDGDARGKHRWLFLGFLAGVACMFILRLFIWVLTGPSASLGPALPHL